MDGTMFVACVEHLNGHIEYLRVYEANGTKGTWVTLSRAFVVALVKGGISCSTYFKDPKTGDFVVGAQVHVVYVNGLAYLRTDKDATAKDNLGSLPELSACPF